MANIVEHKKFVFVANSLNSNKVWQILLYDNNDVEVRYGRIGKSLQSKVHSGVGRDKFDSLIRSKTRPSDHYDGGCYQEVETLETVSSSEISSKGQLKQLAAKQLATCTITQKLVEYFTDVNAHNIFSATGGRISYDTSSGVFKTPIGVVTQKNVQSARLILDTLTDFITCNDFGSSFIKTLESYLMLIPQDVGRKFDPRAFCGDIVSIQKQSQILDGLEQSISSIISQSKSKTKTKKKDSEDVQLFDAKLSLETDDSVLSRIQAYFHKGSKSAHSSSRMKLSNTYRVDLSAMSNEFKKYGSKLTNIHELWHGTSAANILSILKSGFVIPPSNASHVCGRMFGNGVYFSNSSTKSLNYSTGYWGSRDAGRYFMFLCNVALGQYYVPTGSCSSSPPRGYDSYWAKAGKSGVINDEIIVFKTSQILPMYLTEWKKS